MNVLPPDARRRLCADLGTLENHTRHLPSIPVTEEGWTSVLTDAQLEADGRFGLALAAVHSAAAFNDPRVIRTVTKELAEATNRLLTDLTLVQAFQPSADGRTTQAREAIHTLAVGAAQAIVAGDPSSIEDPTKRLAQVAESMAVAPDVVDDPLAAFFGANRGELVDSRGRVSKERIVATLLRQRRLGDDVVGPLLDPVTDRPPPGHIAIRAALPLLTSPRPLITLRTAVQVQELILACVASDLTAAGAALRQLKLRIEKSAASHRGMMRIQAELHAATAPSDVAYLNLDLYKRMMESQVRPWGWTLLRLTRRSERASAPELSTMRDQLDAAPQPLLQAWAEPILPEARNAAAHEDFEWDHDGGVLRCGADAVTASQLEAATSLGYSLMIGAECGWACARAKSLELAQEMDADDPPGGSRTLNLDAALVRFGTNRLHVLDATWEGTVVAVELDELNEQQINPCFQAIIESIAWVSPETFEIRVPGADDPVVRLSYDTVAGVRELWGIALRHFRAMPLSLFLPLNLEARLAVEDVEAATAAAAWLSLDDAVMAYADHPYWIRTHAGLLAVRLQLAVRAHTLVEAQMPQLLTGPYRAAVDLVRAAETSARALGAGLSVIDPEEGPHRLREAYDRLERPEILPTLVG